MTQDNKPLSKEEIYARAIVKEADKNYLPSADQLEKYIETIKNNVELFRFMRGSLLAMDEYAKQEAIGFVKWFWFESKLEVSNEGIYQDMGDDENYKYYSWDETYSLYLKSKENIEP